MTTIDGVQPSEHERNIFVTVGMDHHPFDRLMQWVSAWAAKSRPPVPVIVQYGSSSVPAGVRAVQFLDQHDMHSLLCRSLAVVTSGGPGTVMGAREVGLLPIVVPRQPQLGEHVDGHQLRFARHLATQRLAVVCEQPGELATALDAALADPERYRLRADRPEPPGVAHIAELVDALVVASRQRTRRP